MRLTGFDGHSAFVTGAAGGIGRALVAELVAAGARVLATDTETALASQTDGEDGVIWRALDVRDHARAADLAAEAARLHGPLSLGVHAAGVLAVQPLLEIPAGDWQRLIDINAGGTLNMLQVFGQAMRPQRRGAIVVIGSNAGGVPRRSRRGGGGCA